MSEALMNTYGRLPVAFVRGDGPWLYDADGKAYLDLLCGVAVCTLGHANPAITRAVCEQAGALVHVSNWVNIPQQAALAERLVALSGMTNAFICNSGAEANEAAIKMARVHGHAKGIDAPQIVVTDASFHGRTMATLTATGNKKVQAGFEPLVAGFLRVPYGDADAVAALAAERNDIAAVLVEPIQGEGGVNVPPDDYLPRLREICDANGWLLMLDEIQTGIGRTGEWFGHQHTGIKPDVMTLAKALGNGVPIGACLAHGDAAGLLKPGMHGSTFGGNPLACAAALAVLDTFEEHELIARAKVIGTRLVSGLRERLDDNPHVKQIRGRGLIWGIELDRPCGELVKQGLAIGVLLNVTAERVVRLLPAAIMSDEEVDEAVDDVATLIEDFLAS
ncbi:MAG: acetylornithine transaminase [Chromatiales bacterium]|nr:acetylornithine transaminase [Chromatiales bacterium]